jgi:parallel beta-helix repeat protein
VESSSNNTVGTSNKVNGKSVRYFENQNGITLSGETDVGEVILVNSNSSLIENLDISNTSFGIQLSHSHNNSVINNNASNNKLYGIFLQSSSNNTITQNNASYNNYHGISLATSSNNNTIWNNTFKNNELYEAYCQNSNGNKWFYEQTGNYYGNYTERYPSATNDGRVWNTSYQIYGNAGDEDLFPIVELGGMVEIPSNTPNPPILNSIESPSPTGNITLSWNSVFGAESYKIYRSTSTITDVSSLTSIISGHPTTAYTDQSLTNGTYYYVVVATNASGNSGISNCESVIVQIVIQEPEPNSDDTDDDPNDDEYEILGFPILPLLLSITFAARILVKKQRTH